MERIFRLLILAALVASAALLVMPFEQPFTTKLPLQGKEALLDLCATLLAIVGMMLYLVSAAGLLAFRAWARSMALSATIALLSAVFLVGRFTPWLQMLSPWSVAVSVLASGCWLGALVLTRAPSVRARFLATC